MNNKPKRLRLDEAVVACSIAPDKDTAHRLILAGEIFSENCALTKPGEIIPRDIALFHKPRKPHGWVSRSALKLVHGLEYFRVNATDTIALDVGACTGGFTEVLLRNNAARVYAVDVGYGELAWKLQQDRRVIQLDRTNACTLDETIIPDPINILVCDASFIRLQKILPAPLALAAPGAILIALIKPQFEVAAHEVGQGGIIRDTYLHDRVCREVTDWLNQQSGWRVIGLTESPILGMEGNKEFLIGATYES